MSTESAMTSRGSTRSKPRPRCHHCGRLGHIKRFCRDLKAEKEGQKEEIKLSQKAATTTMRDSESSGLTASHALSVSSSSDQCAWIVDSGATCVVIASRFPLYQLENPIDVMLGDG